MKGIGEGLILFCLCTVPGSSGVPDRATPDSLPLPAKEETHTVSSSLPAFRLTRTVNYSISAVSMIYYNWQQGNQHDFLSIQHELKCQLTINFRKYLKLKNNFRHYLGIRYFPDSAAVFQPDENTLESRLELILAKNLTFNTVSWLSTRIFNTYALTVDSKGNQSMLLCGSFLTPLIWTLSAGFGWSVPSFGNLSLGLSSARLTWIRNKEVFTRRSNTAFYGVPYGQRQALEYGFSVQITIDKEFLDRVLWNCDALLFKENSKRPDFTIRNYISLKISRFLKISLQTRILYEQDTNEQLQLENIVTFGYNCIL